MQETYALPPSTVQELGDNLYNEITRLVQSSRRQGMIVKGIHTLITLFTIVASIAVSMLTSGNPTSSQLYIATILGFILAGLHTFSSTFNLDKRGVVLYQTSHKLRDLARQVVAYRQEGLSNDKLLTKLNKVSLRLADLDLTIYDPRALNVPLEVPE